MLEGRLLNLRVKLPPPSGILVRRACHVQVVRQAECRHPGRGCSTVSRSDLDLRVVELLLVVRILVVVRCHFGPVEMFFSDVLLDSGNSLALLTATGESALINYLLK